MSRTTSLLREYLEQRRLTAVDKGEHPLFFNSRKQKLTRAGVAYIVNKYVNAVRNKNSMVLPDNISPHVLRGAVCLAG
jgi:integrase/recombinase XerD